jgi:hypothetical protein
LLDRCGGKYLVRGLESLSQIPDQSVNIVCSQSVLQLVRRAEFPALIRELRRIQRCDGTGSHHVDMKDCIARSLNNLRFAERFWEAEWFAPSSGFYTNRIRMSEMLEMFQAAGFRAEVVGLSKFEDLPVPQRKLAAPFNSMPIDELRVSSFEVVLQ